MNYIKTFDKPVRKVIKKSVAKTVKNLNSLKKIVPTTTKDRISKKITNNNITLQIPNSIKTESK